MRAKSHDEISKIHDSLTTVKRLSDGIIRIGPINVIGLDGILSWVPIPGLIDVFSLLVGVYIMWQAVRARVDTSTLIAALVVLLIDGFSGLSEIIPIVGELGSLADTLFQGQLYACHMIQKNIEKTMYIPGSAGEAHRSGEHEQNLAEMRATKGKSRIVYLGG
jgi:hypothetical protein